MKDAIDNQKELHSSPTNWAALYHQRAREAFHLAFLMKTLRRQSRCTNGASKSARNSATCATEVADRAIRVCKSDSGVYPPALKTHADPRFRKREKVRLEPLPEQASDIAARKVVIDQTADGDSGESVLIEMPTADASAAAHSGNAGTVEIGSGPTASCAVTFNDPDRMDWRCVLLGTDDDPLDIALTRGVVAEVFGVGAVYWIDKTAEDAAAGTGGRRLSEAGGDGEHVSGAAGSPAPPPSPPPPPPPPTPPPPSPPPHIDVVVAHHMLPDGTAVQDDYEITVYASIAYAATLSGNHEVPDGDYAYWTRAGNACVPTDPLYGSIVSGSQFAFTLPGDGTSDHNAVYHLCLKQAAHGDTLALHSHVRAYVYIAPSPPPPSPPPPAPPPPSPPPPSPPPPTPPPPRRRRPRRRPRRRRPRRPGLSCTKRASATW